MTSSDDDNEGEIGSDDAPELDNDFFESATPKIDGKPVSKEEIKAAFKAALETPVDDADNPPTLSADWENGIVTHGGGVEATLAELRHRRGKPQD